MSQHSKISYRSSKTTVQRTWNKMEPRPFPSQSAANVQLETDPAAFADTGNFTGLSFYGAPPPIQRQEEDAEDTAPETVQAKCSECEAESAEPTVQQREEEDIQPMAEEGEAVSEDETPLQAKLSVGKPGDKYEQEADNMAARVMAMGDPSVPQEEMDGETVQAKPLAGEVTPLVQRRQIQRKGNKDASPSIERQLGDSGGGGRPLADGTRSFMESRFGADFSGVRVHTDSAAVQMTKSLGAQAFTHGQDIYYGKGKSPGKNDLTAHELTHTIQQTGGRRLKSAAQKFSGKTNKADVNQDSDRQVEAEKNLEAKKKDDLELSKKQGLQNSVKAKKKGSDASTQENQDAVLLGKEGKQTADATGTGLEGKKSPEATVQNAKQAAERQAQKEERAENTQNSPALGMAAAAGGAVVAAAIASSESASGGGGAIDIGSAGGEVEGGEVDEASVADEMQQRMAEAAPETTDESGTLSPGEKSAAMAALQEGAIPESPVGGGGGGGAAIAEKPVPPTPDVSQSDPAAAMAALGSLPPKQLQSALGGVGTAIGNTVSREREALAANPPTMETPSGKEMAAAETEAPQEEAAKSVEKAPEGNDVPVQQPAPTPPAPPAPPIPVAAPPVTGNEEGKLSDADARNIQASIGQLPTTDASAPSFSAGAAPTLELVGNADPQRAREQQAELETTAAEAKAKGDRDLAQPMGENEIYATLPQETLTAEMTAGESEAAAMAGNATAAIASAGGGTDAASIIAQEEKGSEIQGAIASAQGEIATKRQERDDKVAQEQEKSNQDIEQLKLENSAQQDIERSQAQDSVEQLRGEWTQEQEAAIAEAQSESDRLVGEGLQEVDEEKVTVESEAVQEIQKGEEKAEEERRKGEEAAQKERQKGEQESGGMLGWVADKAKSFFEGIKKAVQKAFDTARKLMREAIEGAKKLATAAIDRGRKVIVDTIRRVGDAVIAVGDRLLEKFPETREKFRNAIEQKVREAETKVNKLAEELNQGIQTTLDVLGQGLDAALGVMETGMLMAVDAVGSTVEGALQFAEGALQAMGAFAALVPDIAANPGQWVSNLGSGAKDGVQNHLWEAFQTKTQTWFNQKLESIIGVSGEVLQKLVQGGIGMAEIGKMAWNAIKAAIPPALIGLLIEKVVSLIVPAVGTVTIVIESLQAAMGAASQILVAFDAFINFLKAVKGGSSGPQFASVMAAAGIVVIDFVSNWLLVRLMKAARNFAAKLKGIAKGLGNRFKGKKNKDKKPRKEGDGTQQKRNNQDVERDKVAEESLGGGHKAKVTDDGKVYVCSECKVPKLPKKIQEEVDKAPTPKKKAEIVKVHSRYADGTPVYSGQQPSKLPGKSRPEPDPEASGAHTRLQWDQHNKRIYKAREFDADGNPVRDIDFTIPMDSYGKPRKNHHIPEQHLWQVNDPQIGAKSGFKRGKGEPLKF